MSRQLVPEDFSCIDFITAQQVFPALSKREYGSDSFDRKSVKALSVVYGTKLFNVKQLNEDNDNSGQTRLGSDDDLRIGSFLYNAPEYTYNYERLSIYGRCFMAVYYSVCKELQTCKRFSDLSELLHADIKVFEELLVSQQ